MESLMGNQYGVQYKKGTIKKGTPDQPSLFRQTGRKTFLEQLKGLGIEISSDDKKSKKPEKVIKSRKIIKKVKKEKVVPKKLTMKEYKKQQLEKNKFKSPLALAKYLASLKED